MLFAHFEGRASGGKADEFSRIVDQGHECSIVPLMFELGKRVAASDPFGS
jgi:hypothetical protein